MALNKMHKKMQSSPTKSISTISTTESVKHDAQKKFPALNNQLTRPSNGAKSSERRRSAIKGEVRRRILDQAHHRVSVAKKPSNSSKTTKDQNAPKRPLSSYFFFQMEIRKKFTTPGKIDIKKCFPKVKIFL